MTIDLSATLEDELRRLAGASGKGIDMLVEEAVRQYLDVAAITDVSCSDVTATQASLFGELKNVPAWFDEHEQNSQEAS